MKTSSLILNTLLALTFCLNQAHASIRSPDSTQTGRKFQGNQMMNLLKTKPGSPIEEIKRYVLETPEMEFDTKNKLQWPSLPRAWIHRWKTEKGSSNTFVGLKKTDLFGLNMMAAYKLSVDYNWEVKASFVAVVPEHAYSREGKPRDIFLNDTKTRKTYFKVSPDVPIVGLCIYELSFSIETMNAYNFELFGNGGGLSHGSNDGMGNTHLSAFFQIEASEDEPGEKIKRSRFSLEEYKVGCLETYKRDFEAKVTADFSEQLINFIFHNHPESRCKPHAGPAAPEGDASCMTWFNENIGATAKKLTVPRCTLVNNGAHVCNLKAKSEGTSCPVFVNPDSSYSQEPMDPKSRKVSTRDAQFPIYPCDQDLGLSCQLEKEPLFIGSVPITKAKARCQKEK